MKKHIKRIVALALALALFVPTSVAASPYCKGDANGDGKITIADGKLVFEYVSKGGAALNAQATNAADVDSDGKVTVGDAAQILRFASGAESRLPANAVARLVILSPPHKLKYDIGEMLDMTGFKLGVKYTNGQYRVVNRYYLTGYNDLPGQKVITASCRGKLISFAVEVEEPVLTGLELTSLPVKRTYTVGESLSLTGMTVKGTYENGVKSTLNNYSVSGYSGEAGIHTVKVMYMGKSASFTVGCGYKAVVNCGGTKLNVRKGPGTGYEAADAFYEGASVLAVSTSSTNGWIYCWGVGESGNYVEGWCSAQYIKINK